MASFSQLSKKLQTAINLRSEDKLLINTTQWYSKDKKRPITVYQIQIGEKRDKRILFRTYSQIQMVLYLRDYWYTINGWEVPHDNLEWEEIKARNEVREKSKENQTSSQLHDND